MTKEKIIESLLIVDKKTGNIFINYVPAKDFDKDPNLIIGLLTSFLKYTKDLEQKNLKMLDLESFRLIFTEKYDIIFVAISNRLVNPMNLLFKLNTIQTLFLNEFTEDELSNPNIPPNYFDDFIEKIREIMNGDLRVLENKQSVKKILERFSKDKIVIGSAVLSFAGNFLVSTFTKDETNLIQALFNTNFELIISGIKKAFIEFLNRTFYIRKIDDQTLFVVIIKNVEDFEKIQIKIEKVEKEIINVVKKTK